MTNPVDQAAARMAAQLDQLDAKGRDLGRLLEPLRPLAGARAGLWSLRRRPGAERAEARTLLAQLGARR